jgi:pSer/pThr/pTyr-binding forkhead associated (FHA) protein
MSYQLVIVVGRSTSQIVKLASGTTVVGRNQDCQLRIGSSQVSRRHCQFVQQNGGLTLTDLGSSNGTLVNGERLTDSRTLGHGDEVEVGNVKFRVEKLEETALLPGSSPPKLKPSDTAIAEPISIDEKDLASGDESTQVVTATTKTKAKTAAGMQEDEVAEFLLNIELDDEDKL